MIPKGEWGRVCLWAAVGILGLIAFRFYYVQEMLAALILFAVLFVAAVLVVGALFLVDWAGERLVAGVEHEVSLLPRMAHRARSLAEQISKRPLHRPHSQTAP